MQIVIDELNKVHSYTSLNNWSVKEFPEGYSIVELDETEQEFLTRLNIDNKSIFITDFYYNGEDDFILDISKTPEIILCSLQTVKKKEIKASYLRSILWTDDYFLWYQKKLANAINTLEEDIEYNEIMTHWKEAVIEYETKKVAIFAATTKEEIEAITFSPVFTKEF